LLHKMRQDQESPARVLFLDHTAKIGGGEIALLNLVRHLDTRFTQPIVLLFAEGQLAERLRLYADTYVLPLENSVATAPKDRLGWRSLLQLKAVWLVLRQIWRVARFARRLRVDIIHTHSLKSDVIGGLAARLAGIPVIWHVRDRIETDYLPVSVVRVFRFLSRIVPNFVIADSGAVLSTLRPNTVINHSAEAPTKLKKSRSCVVHEGCVVEDLRDPSRKSDGVARIGLIGRISPWKGQHIFIEAAALLSKHHPLAKFEIIGAPLFSERDYETSLHALCRKLKIEESIEFVGFVDDVRSRITELDIVVHASTIGEPFGQVIIEGMAEQKPIVATNGGGVPEIVVDGVTGILVPMGDAPRMSQAIDYLLRNPEIADQMGRLGRERVQAQFTIQKTARLVEGVYRRVLGYV